MSLEPRRIPSKSANPLFLTSSKFQKIQDILDAETRESEESKAARDEVKKLGEISKKMVANWPNTFAGQLKERLEKARLRKFDEEVEKAAVNYSEDKMREEREKGIMDQTYRRLYEQTDRVKRLNAAVNFAEALSERETQREMKRKCDTAFDKLDEEYLKSMLRDVAYYECELVEEKTKEKMDRRKNAENWEKQAREKERAKREERIEKHRVGHTIRDEAARYANEAERQRQENWNQKMEFRRTLDDEIETKQALRKMEKTMEEADEKRAEVFQEAKRKMALIHKENHKEAERQREEKAARMRNHLIEMTAKHKTKDDENMKKAIREKEAELRQQERIKAAKLLETQEEIQKFYEDKLQAKQDAKIENMRMKFREGKDLKELADQMYKKEEEKTAKWVAGEKEAQHLQLHQIAKRNQVNKVLEMEEMTDYMRHMRSLDQEEELFQKYAKMKLEECEKKGWNTHPVKKAAQPGIECGQGPLLVDRANVRPKYIAAVADPDDLHVVPRSGHVLDTKSRLGFTY